MAQNFEVGLLKEKPGPDLATAANASGLETKKKSSWLFHKNSGNSGVAISNFINDRTDPTTNSYWHRVGRTRMKLITDEKAKQKTRHWIALGTITQYYSPSSTKLVVMSKTMAQLHVFCNFHPRTVKEGHNLRQGWRTFITFLLIPKFFKSASCICTVADTPKKKDRAKILNSCEFGIWNVRLEAHIFWIVWRSSHLPDKPSLRSIKEQTWRKFIYYKDNIIIAMESIEDQLVRLREGYEFQRKWFKTVPWPQSDVAWVLRIPVGKAHSLRDRRLLWRRIRGRSWTIY